MMSRTGLMVLSGLGSLASLALAPSAVNAHASGTPSNGSVSRATQSTGGFVLRDVLVSSISLGGGRPAATTRTDGQGGFRFDLPAGAYNICFNGTVSPNFSRVVRLAARGSRHGQIDQSVSLL